MKYHIAAPVKGAAQGRCLRRPDESAHALFNFTYSETIWKNILSTEGINFMAA